MFFVPLWFSYLRETRVSSTVVFMGIDWPWTAIVMSIADFWETKNKPDIHPELRTQLSAVGLEFFGMLEAALGSLGI